MELYNTSLPKVGNTIQAWLVGCEDDGSKFSNTIQSMAVQERSSSLANVEQMLSRLDEVYFRIKCFVGQDEVFIHEALNKLQKVEGSLKCMQNTTNGVESFEVSNDSFGNSMMRPKPFFEKEKFRSTSPLFVHKGLVKNNAREAKCFLLESQDL